MKTAREWLFETYPEAKIDWGMTGHDYEYMVRIMQEFAEQYHKLTPEEIQAIRDEMDRDLEDSGVAQGEIESCLTHWNNKYLITRK